MSEIRSSELETGLSSSGNPVEEDTVVSTPREVRTFYTFKEVCGLDANTLGRFKDRFQFPERVRVRLPGIWLAANYGDMLKVDELVYLYHLKVSEEHGYYELVPWERRTRIVKGLPSSFRYWKSRFFFVSGDDLRLPLARFGVISQGCVIGGKPRLKLRDAQAQEQSKCFSLAEMTSKFNKDMYAKIRAKKDKPLSSIGKKTVLVTGRGPFVTPTASVTPIVSGTETTRAASPSTLIEELPTPVSKKPHLSDKEKEKVDSRPSTIWGDERLAVDRAHNVMTADDLEVLGESLHIASEYLTQKAKLASLTSKMQALEGENSKLKKNLIDSMDECATFKEKFKTLNDELRVEHQLTLEKDEQLLSAKESLKTIAARFIEAFQTTDEYNTVLFSWYFKGFELL
nr:uncharacterized protein LOC112035768 [Quercus suber]